MILVFLDETSDAKYKNYFGLSCVRVNHTKYPSIKSEFQTILTDSGWDPIIEFKGSYLFSASKGDKSVSVDSRVEIAEKLLALNTSDKNYSRMKFTYVKTTTKDETTEYLRCLPALLYKSLGRANTRGGKNVISIQCDYRSDVSPSGIRDAILPVLTKKGYVLLEDPVQATSCFHTVGLLYADIVGYLVARIDNITNDSELFEDITPTMLRTNGKLRKLVSSVKLIKQIRSLIEYQIKDESKH